MLIFAILIFYFYSFYITQGLTLSTAFFHKILKLNLRSLDILSARLFFWFSRFYELSGRLEEIRPLLLSAQRSSTLRHDVESQAVLLNLLLRNYLAYNLYDQADSTTLS